MPNKPNILYFDIETTPIIFGGWRLGKQEVRHDQVLKLGQVLCISWAWNDKKVQHDTLDLKKYKLWEWDDDADKEMITRFIKMSEDADLLVAHNGKFFDLPYLRSRIVKYQLPDIAPTLMDDTYLQSKGIGFMSRKQDFLGRYFGNGSKEEHGSGMDWWFRIIYGDKKTLKGMLKYCDDDVKKLRANYKSLRPYTKSSLNLAVFNNDPLYSKAD